MRNKIWYRIISLICVGVLLGGMIPAQVNADNADAASSDAVSANFVVTDSGDAADYDEFNGAENENWERYFEFGGTDGSEITKYVGPFSKVIIPAKATKINAGAFDDAKLRLKSIEFEEGSLCTTIGNAVFQDCIYLQDIIFRDNLAIIGDNTFRNTGLHSIVIPDSVRKIGSYAYADNKEVTSAVLGKSLEKIGQYAFSNCEKLRDIKIKSINLEETDEFIFADTVIKNVTFEADVLRVPGYIFSHNQFATDTTIVIPASVISIGANAFYDTKNLNIIFEGNALGAIEESAFESSDVKKIVLPDKLIKIGDRAFADCVNITEFKVPTGCEIIGEKAFAGCTDLRKIYIQKNAKSFGEDIFEDCSSGLSVYVIKKSKADKWAVKKGYNVVYALPIKYKLNKGTNNIDNPNMYVAGDTFVFREPVRPGFIFEGWYTTADFSGDTITSVANQKDALVIYAKWTAIKYNVKYELNGDDVQNTLNEKRTTRTCKKPFVLQKAKRKGYKFKGWYYNPDFSGEKIKAIPVTEARDITVYAKWAESSYTVIFHSNGGAITEEAGKSGVLDPIEDIAFSEVFEMPRAGIFESRSAEGYQYTGWNLSPEGTQNNGIGTHYDMGQKTSKLTKKDGAIIDIYAEWTPIEYNINYILDGGMNNKDNPLKHTVAEKVVLLDPEKPGCVFLGWYTDQDFTSRITTIPKNYPASVTVYAKWR